MATDIGEYDLEIEDFLRDLPPPPPAAPAGGDSVAPADPPADVDAEVQVRKKRKPIPKLDEARLLSDPGVARLRQVSRKSLKFKGKGHEFTDMSRLLDMYQLWLDDLYPRAKFRDGLETIEKLGHSKRLKVMRKEWIDATKSGRRETSLDQVDDQLAATNSEENQEQQQARNSTLDTDDLGALMADEDLFTGEPVDVVQPPKSRVPIEEEDDLEAFMRDESSAPQQHQPIDDFAAEEEVLASIDW
ncbi:Swi3-domain-containing protein [Piedraia hortae CBS 480.64]|uniref:Chromosome segregation in meiosis protein n=1 Tax=Piedraia hortae CBS 480.64 TaxID=1314780 RepID=A0A6A7CAR9_9PEZI|nr:Swi3-domain-containing protein [Piedraia hortae CBS 480.64]